MKGSSRQKWQRSTVAILVLVTVCIGVAAGLRGIILRAAGEALVVSDPLVTADIIIVTVDSGGAGLLEAADLIHQGIASRVGIFSDPEGPADREFARRGILLETTSDKSVSQLRLLGVTSTQRVPGTVSGTETEGDLLLDWCEGNHLRSIVVVSTADHSRRLRRVLHRSMRGRHVTVTVRFARFSAFDPGRWWHTRGGTRTEIVELQKLLLDVARHPFS